MTNKMTLKDYKPVDMEDFEEMVKQILCKPPQDKVPNIRPAAQQTKQRYRLERKK